MPRLFLITDRRLCADIPARVDEILALAPTRTVAVQIREKDLDGRELLALTRAVMETGVETWVNDRVDVALAAGAHGVHLPEHGMSVAEARALGIAKVGVSRHTREGVLAASGADLVQYGPIFDTPGKGPALGLDALAVRRELPSKTALVAVGGFETREQARHAAAGGADAVAVIRAAWLKPAKFVAEMVDAVEAGVAMRYAPM